MQRQGTYGELRARWERTPSVASLTVRRSTLRVLIGMGYVKSMFDAGLFMPGQSFSLTSSGKLAVQAKL